MTDEHILEIAKKSCLGSPYHSVLIEAKQELLDFARAIAKAEREACVEACKKELLNEPQTSEDLCYQTAVHHCVTRIEDMQ